MQDFFIRYKLSMLRMYTYHTMIHYTVGFSINISLVYLSPCGVLKRPTFWLQSSILLHFFISVSFFFFFSLHPSRFWSVSFFNPLLFKCLSLCPVVILALSLPHVCPGLWRCSIIIFIVSGRRCEEEEERRGFPEQRRVDDGKSERGLCTAEREGWGERGR